MSEADIYKNMLRRCYDPKNGFFHRYGGRGIYVSERWRECFGNFLADMGLRPSVKHSLDRHDNDGPYSKENCRWATVAEQQVNKGDRLRCEWNGEAMLLRDVPRAASISFITFRNRVKYLGWDIERAATQPATKGDNGKSLPAEMVLAIKKLIVAGVRNRDICKQFGVFDSCVSMIKHGKIYRDA